MSTEEKIPFLKQLNAIVVGLVEIDQECAVLDTIYREQSMTKITARIDETIGSLMAMREKVKSTKVEQYDKSKYSNLLTNKKQ